MKQINGFEGQNIQSKRSAKVEEVVKPKHLFCLFLTRSADDKGSNTGRYFSLLYSIAGVHHFFRGTYKVRNNFRSIFNYRFKGVRIYD